MYYVYKIEIDNIIRYIGYTKDIDQRETQHRKDCYNINSKAYNKHLYRWYREQKDNCSEGLKLVPIGEYKTKVDAKRAECLEVILDYFGEHNLKQKVPSISDR